MEGERRSLLAPERSLGPEERRALAAEWEASNRKTVLAVAPLMVVVHLLGALSFPSESAHQAWVEGVIRLHLAAAPFSLVLFLLAWRTRWRRLGEAMALGYLLFGALLAANAQRSHGAVHAFVVCALASAVLFRIPAALYVPSLVAGCALVIAGVFHFQRDASVAWATLSTVVTLGVVTVLTFFITHAARAKEWIARRALEAANAGLESRVQSQVGEIVARAREVDALNTQLNEKVKERSEELSKALALLSEAGGGGELAAGTVLHDRFVIEQAIGSGGMGVVYRGLDRRTNTPVAIKMIQATSAQELDGLRRFLREARATASVTHPAIVRTLDVDVSGEGRLFQVLELLDGEALDERLRRDGALSWQETARLGAVLADALAAAHAAGIVHRDVKPPNVMLLRAPPGLKLLDFGVSKLRDAGMQPTGETGNRLVGTPEFMAPEQIADAAGAGEKADVYSLGLVLYHAAAGRGPFSAVTPTQWLHAHTLLPPADLSQHVPACPAELAQLVMRCLDKQPEIRPAASEVAALLAKLADGAGVPSLDTLERARPKRAAAPRSLAHDQTVAAIKKP
jgi:Protein kinase domain